SHPRSLVERNKLVSPQMGSNYSVAVWKRQRMVGIGKGLAVGGRDDLPAVEVELLRAGKAGDPVALERLLALHEPSLLSLCYGILGHVDDAEDATRETFLRALRGLSGFRGDASFRTWLFRIAVHICLKWKAERPLTEPWA